MQIFEATVEVQEPLKEYPIDVLSERIGETRRWFHNSSDDHLGHLETELRKSTDDFLRDQLERSAQQKADSVPPVCPKCSSKLSKCQKQERSFETGAGKIRISRIRGWCAKCRKWIFPADELLGLEEGHSPKVQEMAALFVSKMPLSEAQEVMKRATGINLSRSTLDRVAKKAASKAKDQRREMDRRSSQGGQDDPKGQSQPTTLIIEIDAWNIRERDDWGETSKLRRKGLEPQRWHWVWTATVFSLDQRAKVGERAIITNRGFVATREGKDALREQLHAEALRRGLGQAQRVIIIADGAAWIWNLAGDRFGEATQRLDLFHLCEHLWEAARQWYPEPEAAAKWFQRMKKNLTQGKATKVIDSMEAALDELEEQRREAMAKEIHYFKEHQERMDYDQAHKRGEPQGSGAIESTCRQYQCRFKRPGQFWSKEGDDGLLCLDTFWRNERWDCLFPPSSRSDHSRN